MPIQLGSLSRVHPRLLSPYVAAAARSLQGLPGSNRHLDSVWRPIPGQRGELAATRAQCPFPTWDPMAAL